MTIRLVIADDHQLFLSGLTALLVNAGGFEILATASNGIQAIALIKRHQPDVGLLDLTMPGANGFEIFSEARRWSPDTAFVVLTGTIQPTLLDELDRAGVAGLLLKSASPEELVGTIRAVAAGRRMISPEAAALYRDRHGRPRLSPREFEVLHAVARGMTTAQIAELLHLSPKTVDSHRTSLLRKMNTSSTAALLVAAIREGMIDLDATGEPAQDDGKLTTKHASQHSGGSSGA